MVQFINLTPHMINVVDKEGKPVKNIPASGTVARCSQKEEIKEQLGGVDIYEMTFGEVIGLPVTVDNTFYIVSRLVAAAKPERKDLLVPGSLLRDSAGIPIGCVGLARP